jgi:hypothetical protein
MYSTVCARGEGDVQLRIWLGGMVLDFRASHEAAITFCSEWEQKRREAIELVISPLCDVGRLPPLPCEQLFRDPVAETPRGAAAGPRDSG